MDQCQEGVPLSTASLLFPDLGGITIDYKVDQQVFLKLSNFPGILEVEEGGFVKTKTTLWV